MKKTVAFLSVLLALALVLCACGEAAKPLSEVFGSIKEQVRVSELVEFSDAADLDRFYGIAAEDIADFAGGINNSGVDQEEIVLVKASNNDAADRVKTALENRLNAKMNETRSYNPEQYAIVEKCSVETDGLYVSLIISENARQMREIFKTGIGLS